jgi:hypothetical protein
MDGEGSGKRSSKGALWGVKKTTPGMITMAATVVSTLAHVFSEWTQITPLQLTFACGPDATFSDKTRGPTNINWKQRFNQYKQTILLLPSELSTGLFAWYDQRIFRSISASGASNTTASAQGHGDIDELIDRLRRQAIVAHEIPAQAPSLALVPPMTADAGPLPGNYPVCDCAYFLILTIKCSSLWSDEPTPGASICCIT